MATSKEVGNGHGLLCPKCNEGTDDGNSEWDDNYPAKCDCGWEGTVGDFHTVELED